MSYSERQLRGALLEEVILYLLKSSGYAPVIRPDGDPSLQSGVSGLELRGRGSWHQIDAIADFKLTPPFSNPQRLLIEAKFISDSVRLPVIRNAVGVLKDVSENWIVESIRTNTIAKKRFHYLYAIFSSNDFTKPAQDYAYAQDIYLLPLRRSAYFSPVIRAIEQVKVNTMTHPPLHLIRTFLRSRLLHIERAMTEDQIPRDLKESLENVIEICGSQNFGFITMFGGRFPAFLVSSPDFKPSQYSQTINVRIRWRDQTWFIEDMDDRRIFSFDLPEEIFSLYAVRGEIDRQVAADIKGSMMREFYAFYRHNEALQLLRFRMDEAWFETIQRNLRR